MLQYRFARPAEIEDVGRLVAHSFPGPPRSPAWWQEQLADPLYGGGPQTLLVGREGERVIAACQVHPLRQWIGGAELRVAGVGTVAISPARRRRRLGAELVTAALRAARERGDVAAALYPFRTSFYQQLGFGIAGTAQQYVVAPQMLADSTERMRVDLVDTVQEQAAVRSLYDAWSRTQTGQISRSERVWTQLFTTPDRALAAYRAASGALEGYALVTYRTDMPWTERYLDVEEIAWLSDAARRGLYSWLASLSDQWDRLAVRALPSQHIEDWIREPRLPHGAAPGWGLWAPAATLMMGPMFRLLDVAASWNARSIVTGPALVVALEVEDAQIAENTGHWRLVLDGARAAVTREDAGRAAGATGAAGAAGADITLRLDIATLSRLFIGSLSARAALQAGLLACDRSAALPQLDRALSLPEPWTFDRF
jgi:predicted acetyltransferase